MTEIKLGQWNIEWMNDLFIGDPPVFKPDNTEIRGPQRTNTVASRRTDIAGVFNELKAEVWVIVEGPNRQEELQLFFDHQEVNGDWQCAVQPSGAQSLGIAVRTDTGKFSNVPLEWYDVMTSDEARILKDATNPFEMDTDNDGLKEVHKFERRPIYATVNLEDGASFRVLGLHLKSKGVFGAYEWSKWWSRADGNRKKILAQCFQLRCMFLDKFLTDDATKNIPLVVCGDINDGPGFDTSEMKLNASGIERLMGSIWNPKFCLGSALYDTLSSAKKKNLDFDELYTASFKDPIFDGTYRRSWIDHILYSRNRTDWISEARITHNMNDGQPIYRKYPGASDHRPVTCTVALSPLIT